MGLVSRLALEGGGAVRRAMAYAAAILLAFAALIFIALSVVIAAMGVMPLYAALLLGAAFLLAASGGAALLARMKMERAEAVEAARMQNGVDGGWRSFLERHSLGALTTAAAARPGKTLLASLAAGATLGVLDAIDRKRH